MSELENVQQMLDEAKRAAGAGELASAAAILQDVARIQEAELGPLHPELANTVNNLGVVAEMEGRFGDAETYFRRAVAITSASLPPDDPVAASSRKNLEDFCREHGLSFEPAPVVAPTPGSQQQREEFPSDQAPNNAKLSPDVPVAAVDRAARVSMTPTVARSSSESAPVANDLSSTAARGTWPVALVAVALVIVVAVVILVTRPRPSQESPEPRQAAEPAAPRAVEPAPPRATAPRPAPVEQPQPTTPTSRDKKSSATIKPSPPMTSSGAITLVASQLCRKFSVGNNWRCDPAGDSVSPGAIVLYTRVKSPRDAVVIHRWYRGNTLRKSARLTILANTTDGYRTYSRQTVNRGEDWRVEVTNAAGDVLYEQRVSVH